MSSYLQRLCALRIKIKSVLSVWLSIMFGSCLALAQCTIHKMEQRQQWKMKRTLDDRNDTNRTNFTTDFGAMLIDGKIIRTGTAISNVVYVLCVNWQPMSYFDGLNRLPDEQNALLWVFDATYIGCYTVLYMKYVSGDVSDSHTTLVSLSEMFHLDNG